MCGMKTKCQQQVNMLCWINRFLSDDCGNVLKPFRLITCVLNKVTVRGCISHSETLLKYVRDQDAAVNLANVKEECKFIFNSDPVCVKVV